ncbi:MAG: pimeloyl-ACP methyl ester carboxylesterase [Bacillariaceae sp.]|jgi:pimeloyl-ACP methyl ester carboxylesterase
MKMLPSHLLDPTKKKNERPSHTRLGQAPPAPPPSLCLTGAMSRMGRYQVRMNDNNINNEDQQSHHDPIILSYCIFRPRQLYDNNKPPLLCIHGGPSIPSNYLLPIVNVVTDRSVIFYDQWGCGKSSRPRPRPRPRPKSKSKSKESESEKSGEYYPPFSIPIMVEHLRQLIVEHWKLKKFHLLGHSFGGILAYEYFLLLKKPLKITTTKSKQQDEDYDENEKNSIISVSNSVCCSLILSSTPTSAALIQSESERLLRDLNNNNDNYDDDNNVYTTTIKKSSNEGTNDDNDDNKDDEKKLPTIEQQQQQTHQQQNQDQKMMMFEKSKKKKKKLITKKIKYTEEFHQTHECRLSNLPLILMDALRQIGPVPWRGIQAIEGYDIFDITNQESNNEIKTNSNNACNSNNDNIQDIQVQVFPPTLLMRGEYDFCTELCMKGWKEKLISTTTTTTTNCSGSGSDSDSDKNNDNGSDNDKNKNMMLQTKVLSNCSHYGMIEDENLYGKEILQFIQIHDTTTTKII